MTNDTPMTEETFVANLQTALAFFQNNPEYTQSLIDVFDQVLPKNEYELVYDEMVFVRLQVEGLHKWADCPFEEVSYLRDLHRHVFFIEAYLPVTHSDRDQEFIMLKHEITEYIYDNYWDPILKCHNFGGMSCEMIGKELCGAFDLSMCSVSEDNENGGIVRKVFGIKQSAK